MSNITAPLRELSFGYGILQDHADTSKVTPVKFLEFCQENIKNCENLTTKDISKRQQSFNEKELSTINDGLKLAKYVLSKNIIKTETPTLEWIESTTNTGSTIDIIVDNIPFSFQEERFVLDTMELYQLINIIADKIIYKKNLNIFEEYASSELNTWFEVVRDMMIEKLKLGSFQTQDRGGKIAKLSYSESVDKLFLFFYNGEEVVENFTTCDYMQFQKSTSSKNREKVFARYLNKELALDPRYLKHKKECLEKAGENLVDFLKKKVEMNPSTKSLYHLFKIEKKSYYYATTTEEGALLYKIPSQKEFSKNVKITQITSSMSQSHLKISTTIENRDTNGTLVIRNKLKYMHGQFNGAPEGTMFIDSGSLLIAYEEI
ncbi:MAG: hypothetical protein RBR59_02630 [Sulfurimonadaceae bacterium]|jgi:hypothetical protein|nr:hypothetical protein [Sulfurimonadaceae bacterium]